MPYTILEKRDGYELRRYSECVIATVQINANLADAANIGFGPLVRYISGGNLGGERMAMTAPVLQAESEKQGYDVSFVLPTSVDVLNIPVPDDSRITTHMLPQRTMAAHRYRGRWTSRSFAIATQNLMGQLERDKIAISGPAQWARFDPPWTPPFLRTNEVLIPVNFPEG
jgi:hypothetical protein